MVIPRRSISAATWDISSREGVISPESITRSCTSPFTVAITAFPALAAPLLSASI